MVHLGKCRWQEATVVSRAQKEKEDHNAARRAKRKRSSRLAEDVQLPHQVSDIPEPSIPPTSYDSFDEARLQVSQGALLYEPPTAPISHLNTNLYSSPLVAMTLTPNHHDTPSLFNDMPLPTIGHEQSDQLLGSDHYSTLQFNPQFLPTGRSGIAHRAAGTQATESLHWGYHNASVSRWKYISQLSRANSIYIAFGRLI